MMEQRGSNGEGGTDELSRETIFDVLSCRRRRHTLHYLTQQDGRVGLRELSEQLAAWEHGVPPADIGWEQRKGVYTTLRQVHLPRLCEAGIVEFDREQGAVTLSGEAENVRLYLDFVPEDEIPWNNYYLGLSGLSGCLLLLAEGGVVPFGEVPVVVWAAVVVCLFGLSAVAHTYHSRQTLLGRDGPPPGYDHEQGVER